MTSPKKFVKKQLTSNKKLSDKERPESSKNKKRKLSYMLGSRWGTDELAEFYQAYCKYGKDWRKVASLLPNRSVSMVEALYNVNRAYLSLPDGNANAAGLIAMMTDHYDILDESYPGLSTEDAPKISSKFQKHDHRKVQAGASKSHFKPCQQVPPGVSNCRCLSLLRENAEDPIAQYQPRPAGKRTPRVLTISKDADGRSNSAPPSISASKSITDGSPNDTDLAVPSAETSERGLLMQDYRTLEKIMVKHGASRVSSHETKAAARIKKFQQEDPKLPEIQPDRCQGHGALESCITTTGGPDGETDEAAADKVEANAELAYEKLGHTYECERKRSHHISTGMKWSGDKKKNGKPMYNSADERNEGFNRLSTLAEVALSGFCHKPTFRSDERSEGLDRLSTLAEVALSGFWHKPAFRSESIIFTNNQATEADAAKSKVYETTKKNHSKTKVRTPLEVDRRTSVSPAAPLDTHGCANTGKDILSKISKQSYSLKRKTQKRKQKSPPANLRVSVNDANRHASRKLALLQKRGKPVGNESAETLPQADTINNIATKPAKCTNRRKTGFQVAKFKDLSANIKEKFSSQFSSIQNGSASDVMVKLFHCLSFQRLRRWCVFEWFYSTIDFPWFYRNEFVGYLKHVKLESLPKLTRTEWSVLRSALGKPRRFSEKFLSRERENLEVYRGSMRKYYCDLRAGVSEGLPIDLAWPLSIGQCVTAIHPKTRELHYGSVLSMESNRYRVQFDRPDLAVELVLDTDCMPLHSWENLPGNHKKHCAITSKQKNTKYIENLVNWKLGNTKIAFIRSPVTTDTYVGSPTYPCAALLTQSKEYAASGASKMSMDSQACTPTQIQEKNVDIIAVDANHAPCTKEALVAPQQMHEKYLQGEEDGIIMKDSEVFRKRYAIALEDMDDQFAFLKHGLLQYNTGRGSSSPLLFRPTGYSESHHVQEIVESSRKQAKKMVEAAVQATSSVEIREADSETRTTCLSGNSFVLSPKISLEVDKNHVPIKLISDCVATYLMIQRCAHREIPSAEFLQVLETAVTNLRPSFEQNFDIYRQIEMYMNDIKKLLALMPTQSGAFQAGEIV